MPAETVSKNRPKKALSALFVDKVKEPGRYADGKCSCLYLEVDPSGAKRWILRLTIHKKRHDLGLGSTQLVSLVEAREEAYRLRKIARSGGDPQTERRQVREALAKEAQTPTLKDAVEEYYTTKGKPAWRSEKHSDQWISSFKRHVFPQLGARRIDEISDKDVQAVLAVIWTTTPESGRRLAQRLEVIFRWAKKRLGPPAITPPRTSPRFYPRTTENRKIWRRCLIPTFRGSSKSCEPTTG
jgi:Arm DNA-binding domain